MGATAIIGGAGNKSLIKILMSLSLTTSLIACWDAGDSDSWPGSGQSWLDVSGNGHDIQRGSGSGSDSADPTFNGTPGNLSESEYWTSDGGDYFTMASKTFASTWLDSAAAYSILSIAYLPSGINAGALYNAGDLAFVYTNTSPSGLLVIADNVEAPQVYAPSSGTFARQTIQMLAVSANHQGSPGSSIFAFGGGQETFTLSESSSISNSETTHSIGRLFNTGAAPAGLRIYGTALWGRQLTATELTNLRFRLKNLRFPNLV